VFVLGDLLLLSQFVITERKYGRAQNASMRLHSQAENDSTWQRIHKEFVNKDGRKVLGSRDNNNNVAQICKPKSLKRKPKYILSESGLSPKQMRFVKDAISELGSDFSLSNEEYDSTSTHLLLDGKKYRRTVKVVNAIIRGIWVVDLKWLKKCLKRKFHVAEEKYECISTIPVLPQLREWRISGVLQEKLLAGFDFCLDPEIGSSSLTFDAIKMLIRNANGRIVTNKEDAHFEIVTSPIPGKTKQRSKIWLVDCLEKAQNPCKFPEIAVEFPTDCFIHDQIFSFLDKAEKAAYSLVCREWMLAVERSRLAIATDHVVELCNFISENDETPLKVTGARSLVKYKNGQFLAEGSYKEVFKVWNDIHQRHEAMSVMDCLEINQASSLKVLKQEALIATKVSHLVSSNKCRNFVQTYSIFSNDEAPPKDWKHDHGDEDEETDCGCSTTSERNEGNKVFQYMTMELCEHGDLEEFLKTLPDEALPVDKTLAVLCQIFASLEAGWSEISLRHYDVKLLNFFVKSDDGIPCTFQLSNDEGFRDDRSGLVVKLADYGTAEFGRGCSRTVQIDHITTLENIAPEFLLFGDSAAPEGADTFAAGLCMLHLFTGSKPYEEIMADVTCPAGLKKDLAAIWLGDKEGKEENNWSVLRQVLQDDLNDILYDTLYRYVVLIGLPDVKTSISSTKVVKALQQRLTNDKCFQASRSEFSIEFGNHPRIKFARSRLSEVDSGIELLKSLLEFLPASRTMDYKKILRNPVFDSLRIS